MLHANQIKAAYMNVKLQVLTDLPIRHLRNTGMIWAFDVQTGDSNFSLQFYQAALQKGLLMRPIGNTVYFMPPYVIAEAEMDWLIEQTRELLIDWVS